MVETNPSSLSFVRNSAISQEAYHDSKKNLLMLQDVQDFTQLKII